MSHPQHSQKVALITGAAIHPLRRMGEIDDVVEAIAYLENASFVTGEILQVDGGQSAGH
ncbi:MAG: hypothetical protein QOH60_5117 [Mycobacterium sp.]|jgi:NAD(P)-dependent dehydrogenase (short-subunit alcohol dehydrogenase family)|nr:hypothetical protein [Mycobacterium sp.]